MSFSDFLGDLFAGSTTPLGGITEFAGEKAAVNQIFSGINYLQALSTSKIKDLQTDLQGGKFKYFGDKNEKQGANSNPNDNNKSSSTDSIFNKFSVFAYQNFNTGSGYKPEYHFIGAHNTDTNLKQDPSDALSGKMALEFLANELLNKEDGVESSENIARKSEDKDIRKTAIVLANPNVKNIIEWANTTSAISVTGFQPYAMTDFMFCKYYGKITNNRLITLRRYPFPIDDQIKIRRDGVFQSPIPIAQAVTWFGGNTLNTLSKIGVLNWGMPFKKLVLNNGAKEPYDIEGNEVTLDDLIKIGANIPAVKTILDGAETLMVSLLGSDAQYQGFVGTEKKMQDYAKKLYMTDGPYWNRIYGPVNVVHETTQRIRGMQPNWETKFSLNFHYEFRSFSGLSPKIVALDLISNFLNLTYNDAQFLGQLGRYFPKAGVKFNESLEELMGGLLMKGSMSASANLSDDVLGIIANIKAAMTAAVGEATQNFTTEDYIARPIQTVVMKTISDSVPKLIPIRSALSDRAVGEWHLVVGNPLNPIMVMGDLICHNCSMVFDEEFGPDDFPTGVMFTVQLSQGKPRDKISIERMFNLGENQLSANVLRPPSSAEDTFGEANSKLYESLSTLKDTVAQAKAEKRTKLIQDTIEKQPAFARYQNRIRKSYGYTKGTGELEDQTGNLNDSLLYMYFDKSLDRQ